MQQRLRYLVNHQPGALLRQLHQAVLDDVVDEQVNVARDALLVRQLLHGLLDEGRLRLDEVADVLYHLRVQLRVQRVLATLRRVFPQAGTYGNETDYFLKDAGEAQWGPHLERLQAIKRRVDPSNLFRVHNGIGNLKA